MSFNITQPVITETAAAKANKIGDDFTNPATWRSRMDVPSTSDAMRLGASSSISPGIVIDAAASGSWVASTLTGQTVGLADFTIWIRFRVHPVAAGATRYIAQFRQDASNGLKVYLDSSGALFLITRSGGTSNANTMVGGFVTAYAGQWVDLAVTRTASAATITAFINGVQVYTASPGRADVSYTTAAQLFVGNQDTASGSYGGRFSRLALYNRALSAAELVDVSANGIDPADQWGTQVVATSGTLRIGQRYRIDTFVAGDSFTAVGAASNTTGVEFIATGTAPTWTNASTLRAIGAVLDVDLGISIGTYFPDRSVNRMGAESAGGVTHVMPRGYGCMSVTKVLGHASISSSAGTTKVLDLPPNSGILRVEFDRTAAFDGGITLDVGTAGTAAKFVSAQAVSATGIVLAASLDAASQSNAASTAIYVKKSAGTSIGSVTLRVVYEIRG